MAGFFKRMFRFGKKDDASPNDDARDGDVPLHDSGPTNDLHTTDMTEASNRVEALEEPAEAPVTDEQGRHAEQKVEGTTSDVEVSVTGAPDADFHRQAQASVVADEEAGADVHDDSASIEPVKDTPPPPSESEIDQEAQAERAKREAADRKKKRAA